MIRRRTRILLLLTMVMLNLYGSTRDYWLVEKEYDGDKEEEEEEALMTVMTVMTIMMMLALHGSTRDYLLVDRNILTWYKN